MKTPGQVLAIAIVIVAHFTFLWARACCADDSAMTKRDHPVARYMRFPSVFVGCVFIVWAVIALFILALEARKA